MIPSFGGIIKGKDKMRSSHGSVPGEVLPYFSLTTDGGDYYTFPAFPTGDWFRELKFAQGSKVSSQCVFQAINAAGGGIGDEVSIFTTAGNGKYQFLIVSSDGNDFLQYLHDTSPTVGVYDTLAIRKTGSFYEFIMNNVVVYSGELSGAISYNNMDSFTMFQDYGGGGKVLSGGKIKEVLGDWAWPSLISTRKAYADEAKTTLITNGSACAVIETAAGDILQSSAGAMATVNIPPA